MKKCIVVIFLAFTLGSTSLYADDTFGNAWNSLAKEGTQTSLFFYWDPALSAIGAAGNIQLIYPYHLEFIVASYDGYLGLGLDLLQFVWMVGGNNFGGRFGFCCPALLFSGVFNEGETHFGIIPAGILGLYAGGNMDDDLWLGFFAEVRPGYKLGFGEGASSGFSFPVTVGFGGSINFF